MTGEPRPVATSIDLSLSRIVQEAWPTRSGTARATRAGALVGYGAHDITVKVTDDGRGPPPSTTRSRGAGTIRMRGHVTLFGGELQVGPAPTGATRSGLPPDPRRGGHDRSGSARRQPGPVRAGARMILETQADIQVVGEASDGVEAIAAARRLRPEMMLIDIRVPNWTAPGHRTAHGRGMGPV